MADVKPKSERVHVLKNKLKLDESTWEYSDKFVPSTCVDDIHTEHELVEALKNGTADIEANVIATNKNGSRIVKMNRTEFLEAIKNERGKEINLKESDCFSYDYDASGGSAVGSPDFVPLLGGPFYKQLYYYDYIRMHSLAFHAFNHDPTARRVVSIVRDFTLGRGFRVDYKGKDAKQASIMWAAFDEVNDIYGQMDDLSKELSIYGETMIWWLPNNETKIAYRVQPGQEPPKGIIPRIRLLDPSNIWDIVTYPEDITRVIHYQWIAPTQYQTYTAHNVPSSKFIYQQLPADQVMHYKVNSVSNEKRGRSDLFPVLGYMKRLRDSVNYAIIALQKATAWSIDTKIEGSQEDVDAYVKSQIDIGTIPNAGSEFVHTGKVTREYLSNVSSSKGNQQGGSFDWCLSMIAMGTGIPISYFGSHLSGAQTRASALVGSEPVAKLFEMRQLVYERIITDISDRLMKMFGIDAEVEVTFPENIVKDRSAKLRDLATAESRGWISRRRAAEIAASELEIGEFNWEKEKTDIEDEGIPGMTPLTSPGLSDDIGAGGLTSDDKNRIAQQDSTL